MSKNVTALKCPNCDAVLLENAKRCEYCGSYIVVEKQANNAEQSQYQPNIIINVNNTNTNTNANTNMGMYPYMRPKNKWVAFFLCLFLGFLGAHKFYENKGGMGVLYIFTAGLFGIGWFIDCIVLLAMPTNPYYVH